MAGGLKRSTRTCPRTSCLCVLRDSNMPKFVFEDVPLFKGLINDLFPGLDCPRVLRGLKRRWRSTSPRAASRAPRRPSSTSRSIRSSRCTRRDCAAHDDDRRPDGGGKTLVLDTLKNARLKAEDVVVKYWVINPKGQPLNELYGVMDPPRATGPTASSRTSSASSTSRCPRARRTRCAGSSTTATSTRCGSRT